MIRPTITITKISTGVRLRTMFLDHFVMCFIMVVFYIPFMISMVQVFDTPQSVQRFDQMSGGSFYLALFGFSLYFSKDCISGRSVAKRIIKLQLIDNKTGTIASPLKCMIRNLFCIIWPVEVIIALNNSNRRIGDFVAGTKLISYDADLHQENRNYIQIAISVIISYGITLFLSLGLKYIGL